MSRVTVSWGLLTPRDRRKPTISEELADKLGRPPTHREECDEVRRILGIPDPAIARESAR